MSDKKPVTVQLALDSEVIPSLEALNEFKWIHKLDTDSTIDLLGDIKHHLRVLNKLEGQLKERVKSLVDVDTEYDTGEFLVVHLAMEKSYVPAQTVLDEMGQEWVDAHSKKTMYTQLNIKTSPQEAA